jgi:glutathione S-transferase
MLKLYYATGTCALATYITLEEAGADYTAERLSFKDNQQNSPDYLAINPKGRVPALVTDRGVLTETPAMLAYIAQVFPKAKLAPLDDPFDFAQVQSFNSYLCSTVHINHAHKMRGARWATEESSFADMMFRGPWVMGEQFTICDPYLYTLSNWLEGDSVDINATPKIADHFKRMSDRAAVRKVMEAQKA